MPLLRAIGQSGALGRLSEEITARRREEDQRILEAPEREARLESLRAGTQATIQSSIIERNKADRDRQVFEAENRMLDVNEFERNYSKSTRGTAMMKNLADEMGFIDRAVPGTERMRAGDAKTLMETIQSDPELSAAYWTEVQNGAVDEIKQFEKSEAQVDSAMEKYLNEKAGDVKENDKELAKFKYQKQQLLKEKQFRVQQRDQSAAALKSLKGKEKKDRLGTAGQREKNVTFFYNTFKNMERFKGISDDVLWSIAIEHENLSKITPTENVASTIMQKLVGIYGEVSTEVEQAVHDSVALLGRVAPREQLPQKQVDKSDPFKVRTPIGE